MVLIDLLVGLLALVGIPAGANAAAAASPTPQNGAPARPRMVFAHYMGCFPAGSGPLAYNRSVAAQSVDHRSKDRAAQMGGHIRNWDLVPPGSTLSPEESANLEIRRAMRIGIDGFAVDAWAGGDSARSTLDALFKVAEDHHYPFYLTICLDPTCLGKEPAADAIKEVLAKHGNSPRLARQDGKPLIFGYQSVWVGLPHAMEVIGARPEMKGKDVWKSREARATPEGWQLMGEGMKLLEKQVGQPLYLEFCLSGFDFGLSPADNTPDLPVKAAATLAHYVPAIGGFSWLGPKQDEIRKAAVANGAEWMCPVGMSQKENIPYESYGPPASEWTPWDNPIRAGSNLLQYITWNDYGENTNLAPGYNTRYGLYELTRYYIHLWKTGKPLVPDHDELFLCYHEYPQGAKTFPFPTQTSRPVAMDVIRLLLKPATVRLPGRNATYQAPAGLHTQQFPNTPGPVIAEILRDGKVTAHVESPEPITDKPFREDLGYVWCSTEEQRNWDLDFPGKPMFQYSEYGDADHDGLPNWFEMYWYGKWLDFSTQAGADPAADPHHTGKTNLQHYLDQTDPTLASTTGTKP